MVAKHHDHKTNLRMDRTTNYPTGEKVERMTRIELLEAGETLQEDEQRKIQDSRGWRRWRWS